MGRKEEHLIVKVKDFRGNDDEIGGKFNRLLAKVPKLSGVQTSACPPSSYHGRLAN